VREIVEYAIVEKRDSGELQKVVNEAIKEGWQPYGNLVIAVYSHGRSGIVSTDHLYTQALVKYK